LHGEPQSTQDEVCVGVEMGILSGDVSPIWASRRSFVDEQMAFG
jgi:hypothetical protein